MSTTTLFRPRPVHDVLLYGSDKVRIGVFQLQFATLEQLTRLHYSLRSLKYVQKLLKQLVNGGYLTIDRIPTKTAKTPVLYMLSAKGMQYVRDLGIGIPEMWNASEELGESGILVRHTVELNDVIISAALLAKTGTGFHLEELIHERVFLRQPFILRERDVAANGSYSADDKYKLKPDAFLDFRMDLPDGRQRRWPVLLEYDRGTEWQYEFKRKIRGYLTIIQNGTYQERLGVHSITVAFATLKGEKRLKEMRDFTRQVLVSRNEPVEIGQVFRFATLPQSIAPGTAWCEPQWYTAYDDDTTPQPFLAA